MTMRVRSAVSALALLLACVSPAVAGEGPEPEDEAYADALDTALDIEDSLVRAVEKVRRSSVSVLHYREVKRGTSPAQLTLVGCGSGVIVETGGKKWVLTNVHVIQGANALKVVTDDGEAHEVVEHDSIAQYDIALLKFVDRPRGLRGVRVKAVVSKRRIKEGTWVIATGNPFFLAMDGRSVTTLGIISGLDRFLGGRFQYVGAVQHDAEVNPGNSGGPLWNLKGDLVGLNGKIATRPRFPGARPTNTGASFSLPVEQIDAFLRRLTKKGDARAAYFGVTVETQQDDKGEADGARVVKVARGSPAADSKRALRAGDVIRSLVINGSTRRINTANEWREALSHLIAGEGVKVKYRRDRRWYSWSGKLAARK